MKRSSRAPSWSGIQLILFLSVFHPPNLCREQQALDLDETAARTSPRPVRTRCRTQSKFDRIQPEFGHIHPDKFRTRSPPSDFGASFRHPGSTHNRIYQGFWFAPDFPNKKPDTVSRRKQRGCLCDGWMRSHDRSDILEHGLLRKGGTGCLCADFDQDWSCRRSAPTHFSLWHSRASPFPNVRNFRIRGVLDNSEIARSPDDVSCRHFAEGACILEPHVSLLLFSDASQARSSVGSFPRGICSRPSLGT